MEHILQENKDRFVMFPLKYHDIWEMYKTAEHSFWTAEEIDLAQDLTDWNEKLNADEKHYVKNVLANATCYSALFENKGPSLKSRLGIISPRDAMLNEIGDLP